MYSRPSQLFINKILYIRLLSVGGWVGGGGTDRNRRVGRTRMGGGSTEQMCMLHAVVVLWLWTIW